MTEHFLNGSEVRAPLEQVSGERVPEDVRVDAGGVEPGDLGQAAQDQKGPGAGEWAALGVQE